MVGPGFVGLVGPSVGLGVGGVVSPPGKVDPISPILMFANLMLALGKFASMSAGTPESLGQEPLLTPGVLGSSSRGKSLSSQSI